MSSAPSPLPTNLAFAPALLSPCTPPLTPRMTVAPRQPPVQPTSSSSSSSPRKRRPGRPRRSEPPPSTPIPPSASSRSSNPPPPHRPQSSSPPLPSSNPSDLSRKYRPVALHPDELELVGGAPHPSHPSPAVSSSASAEPSKAQRSNAPLPQSQPSGRTVPAPQSSLPPQASPSRQASPSPAPGSRPVSVAAAGAVSAAAGAADSAARRRGIAGGSEASRAAAAAARNAAAARVAPTTTRFPSSWPQVVRQATDAVMIALVQGHDRVLVSTLKAELLASQRPAAVGRRRRSRANGEEGGDKKDHGDGEAEMDGGKHVNGSSTEARKESDRRGGRGPSGSGGVAEAAETESTTVTAAARSAASLSTNCAMLTSRPIGRPRSVGPLNGSHGGSGAQGGAAGAPTSGTAAVGAGSGGVSRRASAAPRGPSYTQAESYENIDSAHFALTIDILNAVVARLITGEAIARGSRVRSSSRVVVFCNSEEEAEAARRAAHPSIAARLSYQVLSPDGPVRRPTDICIVVAPSNRLGDPTRIEAVERIHYCNWNDSNVVIMLNPNLVALTGFSNFEGCGRTPCFLNDYVAAYHLDPALFSSRGATGAMLRCYPRKWEAYMLRAADYSMFRLIGESEERPRPEKLLCDFSWRAEQLDPDAVLAPTDSILPASAFWTNRPDPPRDHDQDDTL